MAHSHGGDLGRALERGYGGRSVGQNTTLGTMTRTEALQLMHEHTQSPSLRQHMLAVEAAMRAYAEQYGEDPESWGIVGLLHDFDRSEERRVGKECRSRWSPYH